MRAIVGMAMLLTCLGLHWKVLAAEQDEKKPSAEVAGWLKDLESYDAAIWKPAFEKLRAAGDPVMPFVRDIPPGPHSGQYLTNVRRLAYLIFADNCVRELESNNWKEVELALVTLIHYYHCDVGVEEALRAAVARAPQPGSMLMRFKAGLAPLIEKAGEESRCFYLTNRYRYDSTSDYPNGPQDPVYKAKKAAALALYEASKKAVETCKEELKEDLIDELKLVFDLTHPSK